MNQVTITVDSGELAPAVVTIDGDTAYSFAQFLKRCSWHTCERLSVPGDKAETQRMINAVVALQSAFREAGYAPR